MSCLAGALLSVSWPAEGIPFLLLISFIPLLFVEDHIYQNEKHFPRFSVFFYSYPAFFLWNLLTTWWIYNATKFGMVGAVMLNAMFMSLIFQLFHSTRKATAEKSGYLSLALYWIAFEYLHLDWDLSWSWLNLGNGFANYPALIQWYEYTGVLGGSLWILGVNILIFLTINHFVMDKKFSVYVLSTLIGTLILIIIPVISSKIIYSHTKDEGVPVNAVVVQPNIDPYNEKFDPSTYKEQVDKMLLLAKTKTDSITDFLVFPETAISESMWENELKNYYSIQRFILFQKQFPKLNIITGLSSFRMINPGEKITITARKFSDSENYFDAFNSALLMNSTDSIQIYHKSRLVPGVEKMPFPKILKPLEKFALDLGGTSGSLGVQKERRPFTSTKKTIKIAPAICYESIYGEFLSKYVLNGAQLIAIITNDGWWGNTPGHKQHFQYARLRAVETRKSIIRSANTGISGFINQRGDIIQFTKWWEPTVIKQTVLANDRKTFYTLQGDYIGRISFYFGFLLMAFSITVRIIFSKRR